MFILPNFSKAFLPIFVSVIFPNIFIPDIPPYLISPSNGIEAGLIFNAVKYIDKPAGKIRIACVEENSFWKFSVADNGPGVEEKYFEKIFEMFQRLAAQDAGESSGIGLSTVKKIVEMYGGKVWVESEIGKGSTFFFTLPKQEKEITETKLQASVAS